MPGIAAVITLSGHAHEAEALAALRHVCPEPLIVKDAPPWTRDTVRGIAAGLLATAADQFLWLQPPLSIIDPVGVRRLLTAAREAGAALAYADAVQHPLIDYQPGSIRDDFDFGNLLVISRDALEQAVQGDVCADRYGAFYELRLRLAEYGPVLHLSDPVARRPVIDSRTSGQKNFDYVDPRKRDYQVEMERIATAHLARIGALLDPPAAPLIEDGREYPVHASVIIPVRNRVKTVGEAVRSALAQQTSHTFNVIVVDNHSEDGTTELLRGIDDARLVHIVPERRDLGIGGCWNEAIYSAHCGRYAVQLDSDDLYDGTDVLARILAKFAEAPYALVIGSYTLVDFDLQPIPPGLIDHREWTDENGHNNALRIAGLGAPRAYHVPTLRTIGFPNNSYGEDYAAVLRLSRSWRLGRIYESLYWCRRWEGNTDSALPLEVSNRYAAYKDRLRTIEIAARQAHA